MHIHDQTEFKKDVYLLGNVHMTTGGKALAALKIKTDDLESNGGNAISVNSIMVLSELIQGDEANFNGITAYVSVTAPNGTFPSLGTDSIINADEDLDTIGFHAHLSMEEKEIKNVSKITVGENVLITSAGLTIG